MLRHHRTICLSGLILIAATACGASPRKFDAQSPIEVRAGTLSDTYAQQGEPLDHGDMLQKLGENPAAAADVSTAETLGVIAMIGATAGGALVGWPLGAAAAGDPSPPWTLAAVGGGLIVVSLPLAFWGDKKIGDAVAIHNQGFNPQTPSRTP